MANANTTKKTTARSTTAKKRTTPQTPAKPKQSEIVVDNTLRSEANSAEQVQLDVAKKEEVVVEKRTAAPTFKRPDRNEEICVISSCPTALGFTSSVNPGVRARWGGVGDEQWLEFQYLAEMASRHRKFFEENWIVVPDEVLVALRMDRYYQNALSFDEYERIFEMDIDEMEKKLRAISEGQKKTLVMRAIQMIEDGEMDSLHRVSVLEEVFGCALKN